MLNPRGYNNQYDVDIEVERMRALRSVVPTNTAQGRFLADMMFAQRHVPSAYNDRAPVPAVAGQAVGQTSMIVPRSAPDPFAPQPPVEVFKAEPEEQSDKTEKTITEEKLPKTEEKVDFVKALGEWPAVPIIVGGVIIIVAYAFYRLLK